MYLHGGLVNDLVYHCVADFGSDLPQHVRRRVFECKDPHNLDKEIEDHLVGLKAAGYNVDSLLPIKIEVVNVSAPKPAT